MENILFLNSEIAILLQVNNWMNNKKTFHFIHPWIAIDDTSIQSNTYLPRTRMKKNDYL